MLAGAIVTPGAAVSNCLDYARAQYFRAKSGIPSQLALLLSLPAARCNVSVTHHEGRSRYLAAREECACRSPALGQPEHLQRMRRRNRLKHYASLLRLLSPGRQRRDCGAIEGLSVCRHGRNRASPRLSIESEGGANSVGQLEAHISSLGNDCAIEVAEEQQVSADRASNATCTSPCGTRPPEATQAQPSADQAQNSADTAQKSADQSKHSPANG